MVGEKEITSWDGETDKNWEMDEYKQMQELPKHKLTVYLENTNLWTQQTLPPGRDVSALVS